MKMKKLLVSTALVATVLGTGLSLSSCGNGGVETYEVHGVFGNAEYENLHKYLHLIDEDTYVINVVATDSKDKNRKTMDMQMVGSYTRTDNVIEIAYGYGNVVAMNGDNEIVMPLAPKTAGPMYANGFGPSTTIQLDGDTFTFVEE